MTPSKTNPLPLSDTLRDLALLRASDIDFSAVLPVFNEPTSIANAQDEVETSVARSYEFVREARAALKVLNRGDVEAQGARVEDARGRLEDVLQGLKSGASDTSSPS